MWELPADRPALMGILNVTPDSFSEHGLNFNRSVAIDAAKRMADEGADLLDIGGESTRPGALSVPVADEIERVVPVIEATVSFGLPLSVDTRKPEVAQAALAAGATIVNDITALGSPSMVEVCVQAGCGVCLMHMQGEPQTMQANPTYEDVVAEVKRYLTERAEAVSQAGLDPDRVWLDPGIGFGKTPLHNLQLLNGLAQLVATSYPILIGVSRKSFIGKVAGGQPGHRLPGTIAAQVLAQQSGVRIIRAHDVAEARQAIDLTAAILRPSVVAL